MKIADEWEDYLEINISEDNIVVQAFENGEETSYLIFEKYKFINFLKEVIENDSN